MPGIQCKCGADISLNLIPCPNEYFLLSDGDIDALSRVPAIDVHNGALRKAVFVYRCPSCGRLIVFWERGSLPCYYSLEPA